jgi:multiple sugar transport system permease protein
VRTALLYLAAGLITLFLLIPVYFIFAASIGPQNSVYQFPKPMVPQTLSFETLQFFLNYQGVPDAFKMSVLVGVIAVALSLLLGAPAGYAIARYSFPGKNILQLVVLATRSFPVIILSIPLAVTFLTWNLYDKAQGVGLVHTAMGLPVTILITAAVFYGVPRDLEEAATTLGCTPLGAFFRVSLPMALPGLAAAALFTFVNSWNEVFAASILTLQNHTLPALVLTSLNIAPLQFSFAAAVILIVPSMVFIFFIRRYLIAGWGQVTK